KPDAISSVRQNLPIDTPPAKRLKVCDFDDDPDLTTFSDFLGQKGTDTTIRLLIQPAEEFNLLLKTLQGFYTYTSVPSLPFDSGFNDRFEAFETTVSDIRTKLDSTQVELAGIQVELAGIQVELAGPQVELAGIQVKLDSTRDELASTRDELASTQVKLNGTRDELAGTRGELASIRDRLSDVEARLGDTEAWIVDYVEARLPLLQFNILQRLFKKVLTEEAVEPSSKSKGKKKAVQSPKIAHKSGASSEAPKPTTKDRNASTVRLIQDTEHITETQLEAAAAATEEAGHYKLSRKFFPYVKRLGDYRNERNDEAHDSGRAFAMIMLHPIFKDTKTYPAWRELVEYVYNMSLEELKKPKEKPKEKSEEQSKHESKF
ncbi:MAG: hypothetical protein Q9194_007591, partial [Teloschistes cf. exilis]